MSNWVITPNPMPTTTNTRVDLRELFSLHCVLRYSSVISKYVTPRGSGEEWEKNEMNKGCFIPTHLSIALSQRSVVTSILHYVDLFCHFSAMQMVPMYWSTHALTWVNSSPPISAHIRHWIGSALVQITACRLFGVKPLSKPMLGSLLIEPFEQTSVKF